MKELKVINKFQSTTADTYIMQKKIIDKIRKIIEMENKDVLIKI